MSECVVRMGMPKNCETCPLRVNDSTTNVPDWICAINQWPTFYCKKSQNHADEDKYLQDCPIPCQLPEGHRDLINRDAIAIACPGQIKIEDGEYWIRLSAVQESIKSAPTIVPAERNKI